MTSWKWKEHVGWISRQDRENDTNQTLESQHSQDTDPKASPWSSHGQGTNTVRMNLLSGWCSQPNPQSDLLTHPDTRPGPLVRSSPRRAVLKPPNEPLDVTNLPDWPTCLTNLSCRPPYLAYLPSRPLFMRHFLAPKKDHPIAIKRRDMNPKVLPPWVGSLLGRKHASDPCHHGQGLWRVGNCHTPKK